MHWDAVPADLAPGWPAGGELLLVWPRVHGDRRLPDWTARPGDPPDEEACWWNAADRAVAARLLSPFHAALLGFLEATAGPRRGARFGWQARVVELVEGVSPAAARPIELTFGAPAAARLLARHGERAVWLWAAADLLPPLHRFLEEEAAPGRCARLAMDWRDRRQGFPCPTPPRPPPPPAAGAAGGPSR